MPRIEADDNTAREWAPKPTFLGRVIYDAMFDLQINLIDGGAEKAEYIAAAVLDALEGDPR